MTRFLSYAREKKTEPQYFQELVDHYEIHSANVKISGECGSDPLSVVTHGLDLYQNEKDADSGAFDRVFCVFDRDAHPNYQAAVQKVQGKNSKMCSSQSHLCQALNTGFCCTTITPRHRIVPWAVRVQERLL